MSNHKSKASHGSWRFTFVTLAIASVFTFSACISTQEGVTKDETTTDGTSELREPEAPPKEIVGSISGTVRDTNAKPIEGATILVIGPGDDLVPIAPVKVAPDGTFLIERVRPGSYKVYTKTESRVLCNMYTIEVTEGEEAVLDISCEVEGGLISGFVLGHGNARSGVPNAFITASTESGESRYVDRSAVDGSFTLRRVPPGEYVLKIRKPGLTFTEVRVVMEESLQEVENVEILEIPKTGISGIILDIEGNPAGPGLNITLRDEQSNSGTIVFSDLGGAFDSDLKEPGTYDIVVRDGASIISEPLQVTVARGDYPSVECRIFSGKIRVSVVGPAGQVLEGLEVRVSAKGVYRRGTTGKDGSFEIKHLPFGEYKVEPKTSSELSGIPPKHIALIDGDASARVTLDYSSGQIIRGVLVDSQDNPIPGVRVMAMKLKEAKPSGFGTISNALGAFEFRGLTEGDYRIFSAVPDYGAAVIDTNVSSAATTPASIKLVLSDP